MKLKVTLLFLLLMVILGYMGSSEETSCSDTTISIVEPEPLDELACVSLADNIPDLVGRQRVSTNVSSTYNATRNTLAKRFIFKLLSTIKLAIAEAHNSNNGDSSFGSLFNQKPQREIFFILRNIRI